MSDVLDDQVETSDQKQVTEDDLRKMLDDVRKERELIAKERDQERATRYQTQQELEAERNARIVTEQERDGNAAKALSEAERGYNAQKEAARGSIAAQKERIASAEEAYARHAEAGDWKAAAQAQKTMAEAAARQTQFEAQLEYLEANKERFAPSAPSRAEVRQAPQLAATDPISQIVPGIMPQERDWLAKRPQFVTDPGYQKRVFGASQFAVGAGYVRGSDPYFKEMARILGEEGDVGAANTQSRHAETRAEVRDPPRREAASSDIAPQRRAAPGQEPAGQREIRLTPDQREVADGLYGNPNGSDYLPNPADRYIKYWENLERRRASGRM